MLERSKAGHLVEVYLPEEIPAIWADPSEVGKPAPTPKSLAASLEEVDFFKTPELRQAFHARERGRCFYCLRQTNGRMQCLDHVVPQAQSGRNSYATWSPFVWNAMRGRAYAPPRAISASSTASDS